LPKQIEYSDGKEFKFGKTSITFSPAVFHGTNSLLGYVTEVLVDDEKGRFLHTSDVEGPSVDAQTDFIIKSNPDIVYLDGPLSYMLGFRYSYNNLERSVKNIIKIFEKTNVKTMIIDHHFLRDLKWKERIKEAFVAAEKKGARLITAAEFNNLPVEMLEAERNELWKRYPKESAELKKQLGE